MQEILYVTEVDAIGLLCPLPVLRARKVLIGLSPGALVRLLADDPMAVVDVPHFCGQAGHDLLSVQHLAQGQEYLIRRGPQSES
jgi:tRNA 2-thiouridine synthesizing protein A